MGESGYCLTTTYEGVALLGLDSGSVCPVTATSAPITSASHHSIAWRGELMYACPYGAGLLRISLRDGQWESASLPCEAVAAHGDDILVLLSSIGIPFSSDNLYAYPSYDALLSGAFDRALDVGWESTRMTVHGDTFYGAWHATDSVNLVDLASGQSQGVLTLEGYDDWILGMSVTDDGRLIVTGPDSGSTVVVFDVNTGRRLGDLHPPTRVTGLSCVTRNLRSD
jgi:hypothetical protein